MVVLIALLLALIPAIAIMYPFIRGPRSGEHPEDEGSPQSELTRRWYSTLGALRNTELEWAIGNLEDEDYRRLREHYMTEAAIIMKKMELAEDEKRELLEAVDREVRWVRQNVNCGDGAGALRTCPYCFFDVADSGTECLNCGEGLASVELPSGPGAAPPGDEPAT